MLPKEAKVKRYYISLMRWYFVIMMIISFIENLTLIITYLNNPMDHKYQKVTSSQHCIYIIVQIT